MKIDETVKKETKYVSLSVIIFSVLMQIIFFILGKYDYTVFLGSIYGGLLAILNFLLLGITVQGIVNESKDEEMKKRFGFSYRMRSLLIIVCTIIGILSPIFNSISVILSLLFPKIYCIFLPFIRKDLNL